MNIFSKEYGVALLVLLITLAAVLAACGIATLIAKIMKKLVDGPGLSQGSRREAHDGDGIAGAQMLWLDHGVDLLFSDASMPVSGPSRYSSSARGPCVRQMFPVGRKPRSS